MRTQAEAGHLHAAEGENGSQCAAAQIRPPSLCECPGSAPRGARALSIACRRVFAARLGGAAFVATKAVVRRHLAMMKSAGHVYRG